MLTQSESSTGESAISQDKREEFQITWDKFLEMRKKIKKPPTEYAITLLKSRLKKLSNGGVDAAIEILNQSIINNWQNVYAVKK